MMLGAILFAGVGFVVVCSDTPVGRSLHAGLVEAPAKWLARTSPLRATLLVGLSLVAIALACAMPEYWGVVLTGDFIVYLDVTLAMALLGLIAEAGRLTRPFLGLVSRSLRRGLGPGRPEET